MKPSHTAFFPTTTNMVAFKPIAYSLTEPSMNIQVWTRSYSGMLHITSADASGASPFFFNIS